MMEVIEQATTSELRFDNEDILDKSVSLWADAAVSRAVVRGVDDPDGCIATTIGIEGAWGFGGSEEEALDELRSVLIGWVCLKLHDGDDDIPSMGNVHLVVPV